MKLRHVCAMNSRTTQNHCQVSWKVAGHLHVHSIKGKFCKVQSWQLCEQALSYGHPISKQTNQPKQREWSWGPFGEHNDLRIDQKQNCKVQTKHEQSTYMYNLQRGWERETYDEHNSFQVLTRKAVLSDCLEHVEEIRSVLWVLLEIFVDHIQRALEHSLKDCRHMNCYAVL